MNLRKYMWGHGFRIRNEDEEYTSEVTLSFELACLNTWFQKLNRPLITYESGAVESQIDDILVKGADKNNVMNCKAIFGEACVKQHRLTVMDFKMRDKNSKKRKNISRIKVWDLNGEKGEKIGRGNTTNEWEEPAHMVCRKEKNGGGTEVQESVKRKSKAIKDWKDVIDCLETEDDLAALGAQPPTDPTDKPLEASEPVIITPQPS
ncbi:uncharacterized protein [Palaemon carinicauda]|uniref:uncharacterized protein n=1 Tax=Palaemon carinicauda TaxID=392227 RepID=UPI0035B5B43D